MASDLVFIAFPTEAKAEEVRQRVLALQREYLIELGDAVVVVKDPEGQSKRTSSSTRRRPARCPAPFGER